MADHIILATSDGGATLSKWFRVIAEGYSDGDLSKSQNVKKTVGGGIDASVGAVYKSWNPIIRVRQEEVSPFDYGTLADLEELYEYNDPGGTPNNIINFVDHHGQSRDVLMVGDLKKQGMGAMIEGTEAWFLVMVQLQEVV